MSVATSPIRHPDTSSPDVMRLRGWWLVVLNVVVPGSAQALAGNRRLGRIGLMSTIIGWAVIVLTILIGLISREFLSGLAVNFFILLLLQAALVYYCVLWIVLTLDTLRLVKFVKIDVRPRAWIAAVSVVLLTFTAGGAAWGASTAGSLNAGLSGLTGGGNIFDRRATRLGNNCIQIVAGHSDVPDLAPGSEFFAIGVNLRVRMVTHRRGQPRGHALARPAQNIDHDGKFGRHVGGAER